MRKAPRNFQLNDDLKRMFTSEAMFSLHQSFRPVLKLLPERIDPGTLSPFLDVSTGGVLSLRYSERSLRLCV